MIITKFGGSSVKDASSLLHCLKILQEKPERCLAVVSASGKTTNQLDTIWCATEKQGPFKELVDQHRQMARELEVYPYAMVYLDRMESRGKELLKDTTQIWAKDEFLSLGEQMSSFLFYRKAQQVLCDRDIEFAYSYDFIKTDSSFGEAIPNIDQSFQLIKENIKPQANKLTITQGFLGMDSEGRITTLGREGSDYSASLFTGALEASLLEIWTDVDGVYNLDPNRFQNAKRLHCLSFHQADHLAKSGMKVLFKRTMEPLNQERTMVFVGKTSSPEKGGTIISKEDHEKSDRLGISVREMVGHIKLTLDQDKCSKEHALTNMKILFEQLNVYPLFYSAEDILLEGGKELDAVTEKLKEFAKPEVFLNRQMINLIGDQLHDLKSSLEKFIQGCEEKAKTLEVIEESSKLIRLVGPQINYPEFFEDLENFFFRK